MSVYAESMSEFSQKKREELDEHSLALFGDGPIERPTWTPPNIVDLTNVTVEDGRPDSSAPTIVLEIRYDARGEERPYDLTVVLSSDKALELARQIVSALAQRP